MDAEIPTMAMVGNVKENLPFQKPYFDVKVDGGGIDTNGDGQRLNNGTDTVPPQIVAVTDNGISYDSVQFSQSATLPAGGLTQIGPSHRKIHSIQAVTDSGDGCDAPLSGGGTHGNVVAGVIAGDASPFGSKVSKHIYNNRPRVDGIELSGARIGPDLTGVAVHPKSHLLVEIMDPSRSVEGNYRQYVVTTTAGRVVPGLLASETRTAVEILDAEGKRHSIQREDIDELHESKKSLMERA